MKSPEKVQDKKKGGVGSNSVLNEEESKVIKKIMPEPLPLLPKVTTVFSMPPKCPMESIKFI